MDSAAKLRPLSKHSGTTIYSTCQSPENRKMTLAMTLSEDQLNTRETQRLGLPKQITKGTTDITSAQDSDHSIFHRSHERKLSVQPFHQSPRNKTLSASSHDKRPQTTHSEPVSLRDSDNFAY